MGTNIDELIEDISNNKLSSEESSMVDSIINDLNVGGGHGNNQRATHIQPPPQQYSPQQNGGGMPPQLTPEEKQMLLKQQQQQQQMMYEQQMQQQRMREMQQMQQQQQREQEQQQQREQEQAQAQAQEQLKKENESFLDKLPFNHILQKVKTSFVVFLLIVFFNLNPIDDFLRFKQFSIFYDIKDDKSTFLFAFVKAMFISVLYYFTTYLLK